MSVQDLAAQPRLDERTGLAAAGLKRGDKVTCEQVLDLLSRVPNDDLDYDSWLGVAMAIHNALGEEGGRVFQAWSARGSTSFHRARERALSGSSNTQTAMCTRTWLGVFLQAERTSSQN